MLGGVAPVVIFNFPTVPDSVASVIKGIPLVGGTLSKVGLPIPIYLARGLTGIVIESETRGIDVQATVQARNDGQAPQVDQRTLENVVTVQMTASRDNVVLAALLALCDMAFTRVVSKNYGMSYLSTGTVILNGLLRGFNTQANNQDDLVHITMEISKANTAPVDVRINNPISIGAVTGALPTLR